MFLIVFVLIVFCLGFIVLQLSHIRRVDNDYMLRDDKRIAYKVASYAIYAVATLSFLILSTAIDEGDLADRKAFGLLAFFAPWLVLVLIFILYKAQFFFGLLIDPVAAFKSKRRMNAAGATASSKTTSLGSRYQREAVALGFDSKANSPAAESSGREGMRPEHVDHLQILTANLQKVREDMGLSAVNDDRILEMAGLASAHEDVLSRMEGEAHRAAAKGSIEGVIIDAYPGHEMSCPQHGAGGVDIVTGEAKHRFRITGDRVVCTKCGRTAINPSQGGKEWTGVNNDINIPLIIAHRRALMEAMGQKK
jgi:hypothetical protein